MDRWNGETNPEAAYIVETFGKGAYLEYRIPGIVITDKGTLLCCYEGRANSHDDWAPIDIVVLRSTDGGKTFCRQVISGSNEGKDTWNNPVLIADGAQVHVLYHKNYEKAFHCVSLDEGETFSKPADITEAFDEFPYRWNVCASGPGHGIVTRSGRLVVPVWMADGEVLDSEGKRKAHKPSVCGIIYSDDKGESWHGGIMINGLLNANETSAVELMDGRLLLNIRNGEPEGYRWLAVVADKTWTLEELRMEEGLPDPRCFGGMCQGRTGGIYFVNCANREPGQKTWERINLTVYRSRDEGENWRALFYVDAQGGYADITCDENFIYVFYEQCSWTHTNKKIHCLMLKKYKIQM